MPYCITRNPYVTGNSVIAMKYKDGVIMACDTGASYGSTLRYKSVERIKAVGKHSLIGGSGEFSDFQEILRYLDELTLNDHMWDDGNSLGPKEIHAYLTRVMYNRRNKFDPLWNSLVLGGVKKGPKGDEKYLGMVNMIGTHFEENHIATGFGNHMAIPILRGEWREDMTFEEAVKLIEKCLLVLLYRDRSSINKFQIAKITTEGSTIYPPYALKTNWGFAAFENPSKGAVGTWLSILEEWWNSNISNKDTTSRKCSARFFPSPKWLGPCVYDVQPLFYLVEISSWKGLSLFRALADAPAQPRHSNQTSHQGGVAIPVVHQGRAVIPIVQPSLPRQRVGPAIIALLVVRELVHLVAVKKEDLPSLAIVEANDHLAYYWGT
ncbi:unnamed protein product [Triticum turgidum subsp. durum]|uniref:Proteasome subunit beta type-4 n=2 Tax=Triticum TaxID=4564 RepID=A0A9R0W1T8_TRITD|nr:unnamed protein product [Triticum turgidum subsp. durum]